MGKLKAIFIGENCTGKSCIAYRIKNGVFNEKVTATPGADSFKVDVDAGDKGVVHFEIWDINYQQEYECLTKQYIKGAALAFIFFDLTDRETFDQIQKHSEIVKSEAKENVKIVLVGNKTDMANLREVSKEEAEDSARKIGAEYYTEVSALTGDGVDDLLSRAVRINGLCIEADNENKSKAEISSQPSESRFNGNVKLSLIGDMSVGKTCIIERILDNTFNAEKMPTVGANACSVDIDTVNEGVFRFNIWDTAGQAQYRNFTTIIYRDAALIFLVFDLTKLESFEAIYELMDMVNSNAVNDPKIVLIGNKADLINERKVSKEDAEECANEIGAEFYIEVSAKTGEGIKDLFTRAALIPGLQVQKDEQNRIRLEKNSSNGSNSNHFCC